MRSPSDVEPPERDEPEDTAGKRQKAAVDSAGGTANEANEKKRPVKQQRKKHLAGAVNAPLRRRIALAQGGAPRATSHDTTHSDWAQALIAACTISPAGAPPAAEPRTGHSAAPWLPSTPPSRPPVPPRMLHAMPVARSTPGSASSAPPSQAGEAGLAPAIQAMVCPPPQTGSRHSLASVKEQQEEQGKQAMPTLHGRQVHQAVHAAAASSTCCATSSLSSGRGNRAPLPQRHDSIVWDRVNINTSGLLDEALDSV